MADVTPPGLVSALDLCRVELPDWHPRHDDGWCPILAHLIHHPDGPILVDTGVGDGSELIDELYQPTIVPVVHALNAVGVDERDIVTIVNTHLHFDHCGQNDSLPHASVHVQAAEIEAARAEFYTVPEWAEIEPVRRRVLDGDEEIAPGVRILSTPGHTPGHQSVLVDLTDGFPTLLVGQCCYDCAEFARGEVVVADLGHIDLTAAATASLDRLRGLDIAAAHFSHDPTVWRPI